MSSIFTDKNTLPSQQDLKVALGPTFELWEALAAFVKTRYPAASEEWNFPGAKFGWSFRMKDKKRAIVYLLPRDQHFEVAFVFGQKATDLILVSGVSDRIKTDLQNARVYAEGRGLRIEVRDAAVLQDIKVLVDFKLRPM